MTDNMKTGKQISIRQCANIKSALLKYNNKIVRSKIKLKKKEFKMPLYYYYLQALRTRTPQPPMVVVVRSQGLAPRTAVLPTAQYGRCPQSAPPTNHSLSLTSTPRLFAPLSATTYSSLWRPNGKGYVTTLAPLLCLVLVGYTFNYYNKC